MAKLKYLCFQGIISIRVIHEDPAVRADQHTRNQRTSQETERVHSQSQESYEFIHEVS